MTQQEALRLADRLKYETQADVMAWPLGNGEWCCWFACKIYIFSETDWASHRDYLLPILKHNKAIAV